MTSRVDNFIIREPGGSARFAGSLVLGAGLTIRDTEGGLPELSGSFNGAKVWLPAGVTPIPSSTEVVIPLAQVALDTAGFRGADPTRLTVPAGAAGIYLVIARGVFSAGPSAMRVAGFRLNGGSILGLTRIEAAGSSVAAVATEIVPLQEGDYLELRMYQESGTVLNAIGGVPYETSLMLTRLGV
jgi:hypothetical protein